MVELSNFKFRYTIDYTNKWRICGICCLFMWSFVIIYYKTTKADSVFYMQYLHKKYHLNHWR